MAKTKAKVKAAKSTKAAKKTTRRKTSGTHFYGVEHEFILITGGGFLVILLTSILFFH